MVSSSGAPASIGWESKTNGKIAFSLGAPDGSDSCVNGVQNHGVNYDVADTINTIKDGQYTGLEGSSQMGGWLVGCVGVGLRVGVFG